MRRRAMKKTAKRKNTPGIGYPSFREIAYHHWRKGPLPAADELIRREAAREFIEEDDRIGEWEEAERRWTEEKPMDDEPGGVPWRPGKAGPGKQKS
jgi:hypothetical protein